MSTITGLYKLNLEEDQSNILEENAKLHKRFSRITFKVIKFNPGDRVLMIRVSQNKSIHQNQMLVQDLARICRELFSPIYPDYTIHVDAQEHKRHHTEIVTPKWIQDEMTKRGINSKELVEMTGINKSNISAWINDIRPMSQPAKALFYFLFKNWKN